VRFHGGNRIGTQLQPQGCIPGIKGLLNGLGRFEGITFLGAVHSFGKFTGTADAGLVSFDDRHVFQGLAGKFGPESTGFYDQYFDPEWGHFAGQCFRDAF
jgi:hypothetical protein